MTIPVLTPQDRQVFADARGGRPRTLAAVPDAPHAAFRAALRAHRARRRWSQERLALEAEIDHSLISRLEAGQRNPTPDAIGKLATGLALDPAATEALYLAAGLLPPTIAAEEWRAAVAYLRETTPGEREAALALVRAARRL